MQVREARISPPESHRRNHCGRRIVVPGLCSLREVKWCHLSGLGFRIYGLGFRKKFGCSIFVHKINEVIGIFRV